MQSDNAKEVVDFLTNKFTKADLYDWMSGILERAYSFFLQQETAMAQLAPTIDYTALNSFDYRQEVIQSPALNRPVSADRAFSFRNQFADGWFDDSKKDYVKDILLVITYGGHTAEWLM